MTVRELLERTRLCEKELESKLGYAEYLNELIVKTTNVLSEMDIRSADVKKREETISKVVDLRNEIMYDVVNLVEMKKMCEDVIRGVGSGKERMLLTMRYLNDASWSEIATAMCISDRTVYRMHSRALREAEQALHRIESRAA